MDIYRWTAKRAGAAITVHGYDANNKPVRVPHVGRIGPTSAATAFGAIVAYVDGREAHRLMLRP